METELFAQEYSYLHQWQQLKLGKNHFAESCLRLKLSHALKMIGNGMSKLK